MIQFKCNFFFIDCTLVCAATSQQFQYNGNNCKSYLLTFSAPYFPKTERAYQLRRISRIIISPIKVAAEFFDTASDFFIQSAVGPTDFHTTFRDVFRT